MLLKEIQLLKLLVDTICSFDSPRGRNLLVQKTLSYQDVWNSLTSFELGHHFINQLTISWIISALSANTNLDNFRRSLFFCLLALVQIDELDPSFSADPLRIEVLDKFLEEQIPVKSIFHFINDLNTGLPALLPPPILSIITTLCNVLKKRFEPGYYSQ